MSARKRSRGEQGKWASTNQISQETNPTNSSYIFILSVNFENLIVRLHILITSLMLTKFQEIKDQLLCHQINVIISSFCNLKLYVKNKIIDQIVNNIRFERNLIYMLRS